MNNIVVPKEYRNMLRPERDNDARDIAIRELIEARSGYVLTVQDFNEATGVSSGMLHVKRLMKAGRITRTKVKKAGERKGYAYKWHSTPLLPKDATILNGGTFTRSLNLPTLPFTKEQLKTLAEEFNLWVDQPSTKGSDIEGARAFRHWLDNRCSEITTERERLLNNSGQA